MTVKYKRVGYRKSDSGASNRYEIRRGFVFKDPKQRLVVIYLGLIVASMVLLMFHFLVGERRVGFLEIREGEATVLDKRIDDADTPDARYVVVLEVAVPPASPEEAAFVREDHPDRDKVLGALDLSDEVVTTEEGWQAIPASGIVQVEYQINASRTQVVVRSITMDESASEGEAGAAL